MSNKFWSELAERLTPYVPGEQRQGDNVVKLNTNENPYPPSPRVLQAIAATDGHAMRRYPDPTSIGLRESLAQYHSIDAANVFVGNGSDEILALAFMAFFTKKAKEKSSANIDGSAITEDAELQFPELSYSFYPVYCDLLNIPKRVIPMCEDFSIDMPAFDNNRGGIIFPNPNAPTSLAQPKQAIEALLERVPDTLVLVDEAYVDFGGQSVVQLVNQYPNLVVSQTFSKSRSLAGMRLGSAYANPNLIEALERVKNSFNSYPCDVIAQRAGIASLADDAYYQQSVQQIIATRNRTSEALKARGFRVLESATNFLFVSPPGNHAQSLFNYLSEQGVLVRYWNSDKLEHWIRVSVGTDEDMNTLLSAIDKAPMS